MPRRMGKVGGKIGMIGRGAYALAALAILMRLAIPAGFMPVKTADGIAVTLCTGQGAVIVHLDKDGHKLPDPPAPDSKSQHPCAFAGASAVAIAPVAGTVAAPLTVYDIPQPERFYLAPGLGLAAPPPAKTGPPAFA